MRSDPELIATLTWRARLLARVRQTFEAWGFVEVTTPSLVVAPDPAVHLESFRTTLERPGAASHPLYLPTSPEHHMKRMLVAGMKRIYQICPFFRNGEVTPHHNPVFTGLEWYEVGARVEDTMARTETLCWNLAQASGLTAIERDCRSIDLRPPYRRLSVRCALEELGGIAVPAQWHEPDLRLELQRAGIRDAPDDSFDDLVNRALLEFVEPALRESGPTFLTDYPAPMAAQARLRDDRPWEAERFELFIGGLELCNGYGELSDAALMRQRFTEHLAERKLLGRAMPPLDEAYLVALERGLPACSGNALGLDRLVMLLCGKLRIEEVIAFPLILDLPQEDLP